ncbi:hypothetical protein NKH77_47700 [Streptomyces sp. M19]
MTITHSENRRPMPARRFALFPALVVAAATACLSGTASAAPRAGPAPAAVTAGTNYVAMGSSFAAGPAFRRPSRATAPPRARGRRTTTPASSPGTPARLSPTSVAAEPPRRTC